MNNQGNDFSAVGKTLDDKPVKLATNERGYCATLSVAEHAPECLKDHAATHADQPGFHSVAFLAPQDIAKYRGTVLARTTAPNARNLLRPQPNP